MVVTEDEKMAKIVDSTLSSLVSCFSQDINIGTPLSHHTFFPLSSQEGEDLSTLLTHFLFHE
jgi:hypothetical protein